MGWFTRPTPADDSSADSPEDHDDALSLFINCFFQPMLEDGRLDDEEFVPLEAAYFGLRVNDEKGPDVVRNELLRQVEWLHHEPPPPLDAGFCARLYLAWDKKIDTPGGLPRISRNEREELFKWIAHTLQKCQSTHAAQITTREDDKWGARGASGARDEKRYAQGHLQYCGIGTQKPGFPEKDTVRQWFREVSKRLKSFSDKPAGTAEGSACATASFTTEHGKAILTEHHTTSRNQSDSLPLPSSRNADVTSPQRIPLFEVPEPTDARSHAGEMPTRPLGGTEAAPPSPTPVREEPTAAPPTVHDVDIAELLRELPPTAAACQVILREQSPKILANVLQLFGDFSAPQRSPLAFSRYRTSAKGQVIVLPEAAEADTPAVWFLGDIHGDILALDAAVRYVDAQSPGATIVLLGDLFDDQGFGYEVVLRVLDLIASRPGRIGYIAGNHDVALSMRSEPELVFSSSVSPSDFADFLNDFRDDKVTTEIGEVLVRFFAAAPRAVFFPCGLIAAHAGVPLGSRWEHIATISDLERDDCLQDFTWTRAHERARKKIPNPSSKTSEFGFEDFSAFCEFATSRLGLTAERIIRGHDHFETGYSIYPKWVRNQCVTINTMSRRLPRDPFGAFHRTPCVARWVPGAAPEVHCLTLPGALIDSYYLSKTPQVGEASRAPASTH